MGEVSIPENADMASIGHSEFLNAYTVYWPSPDKLDIVHMRVTLTKNRTDAMFEFRHLHYLLASYPVPFKKGLVQTVYVFAVLIAIKLKESGKIE